MVEITPNYGEYSEAEIKEYCTGAPLVSRQKEQLLAGGKVSYILHTSYGIGFLMSQGGKTITWIRE